MIGVSKIQYRITEYNHQLLVLPGEHASKRLITRLGHNTFSDPLPELSLRGPELLAIAANHEGSFLFFLLLEFVSFLRSQIFLPRSPVTPLLPISMISRSPMVPTLAEESMIMYNHYSDRWGRGSHRVLLLERVREQSSEEASNNNCFASGDAE